jgi:hypothetical protein
MLCIKAYIISYQSVRSHVMQSELAQMTTKLASFGTRWALFIVACVLVHYSLEPVHHLHCRRSIFHVMFWKKSQFCSTLEAILTYIENMFDGAHAGFLKRVGQVLDISTLFQPALTAEHDGISAIAAGTVSVY